jgi:hypothetical protein
MGWWKYLLMRSAILVYFLDRKECMQWTLAFTSFSSEHHFPLSNVLKGQVIGIIQVLWSGMIRQFACVEIKCNGIWHEMGADAKFLSLGCCQVFHYGSEGAKLVWSWLSVTLMSIIAKRGMQVYYGLLSWMTMKRGCEPDLKLLLFWCYLGGGCFHTAVADQWVKYQNGVFI